MKPSLKIFVSILLVGALSSLLLALFDHAHSGKWLSSAGLMFDIAGIAQLDIGTFFQVLLDRYSDDEKYPKGPPSHFTRRLFAEFNPDQPIRSWINDNLFYQHRTGFYLLVLGFVLQLIGTWR
jgi:hypothetical protein